MSLPFLVLMVSAFFRFHALSQDMRLLPDEALFSTFARSAAVNGDWLLRGPLDKTPLTIYANALSMTLFGVRALPNGVLHLDIHVGEFGARVPGTFASVLLVAVMYRLARDLYPRRMGTGCNVPAITMLLMAFSPFAIAYSATALTDGLMLLFMALSLMMIARERWGWSGMFLALGFASKQQALYYLPLLLLVGWATDKNGFKRTQCGASANFPQKIFTLALPTILILIFLLVWDSLRAQPGGVWGLAVANNNPARLIRAHEVLRRLLAWADHGQLFAGPGWLTALLALLAITAAGWRIRHQAGRQATLVDVALITYFTAYVLAHWLVAFNTYDRYLLPVLPIALLLMARGIEWFDSLMMKAQTARLTASPLYIGMAVLCLAIMLSAALQARARPSDHPEEYHGIDDLADYLNGLPLGTIIYDHWLGWELGYYLGAWSDKRRVYYPTPDAFAAGALLQPDTAARYFPVPAEQPAGPWLEAVTNAGFSIRQVYSSAHFLVYELMPPVD